MRRKVQWRDLNTAQRTALVVTAVVEVTMTAAALVDLARRPAREVRGPKLAWTVGCFVQPIGPAAYFRFGRRR
jgi:hypothetical protein